MHPIPNLTAAPCRHPRTLPSLPQQNSKARWLVSVLGDQGDTHPWHFHGNTLVLEGERVDAWALSPSNLKVLDVSHYSHLSDWAWLQRLRGPNLCEYSLHCVTARPVRPALASLYVLPVTCLHH